MLNRLRSNAFKTSTDGSSDVELIAQRARTVQVVLVGKIESGAAGGSRTRISLVAEHCKFEVIYFLSVPLGCGKL